MKPRKKNAQWGRGVAIVAMSAGAIAIGTAVSSSIGTQPAPEPPPPIVVAERPSFLSELPERTQQALQAGLIEPTTARMPPDVSLPVRVASAPAALSVTPAVETETAESQALAAEFVAAEERVDAELFKVTANGLNVRAGPSGSSGKLFVLKQNEAVQVAEIQGNWARVTTSSGESGWAFQKYLAPAE